jgi:hypothetical protein
MSIATRRAPVTARIAPQHVDELRRLAYERDTTVSRLIARAVADHLAYTLDGLRPDSDPSNTKQGVRGESEIADLPGVDRGASASLPEVEKPESAVCR